MCLKCEASVELSACYGCEDGSLGLRSKVFVMKNGPLGFEELLEMSRDLLKIEDS